jgi:hypothetical protein
MYTHTTSNIGTAVGAHAEQSRTQGQPRLCLLQGPAHTRCVCLWVALWVWVSVFVSVSVRVRVCVCVCARVETGANRLGCVQRH